ncbi:hypothetical protein EZJ49_05225 [Bdellovibrio bacteriovorus]|uniref:hypothetical protein n=1 Tax=Bdellovibrio bacteriovorus TaxID=959 RepID=UPI0021CEBA01|nr:hypothetical protein [Bdellovibrio bacteriovorus]UXR65651.1 hypothetical protein EZJ49_05225 [Bdellovibrio bacteriovorus]
MKISFVLKISMMLIALAGVLYAIRALNTGGVADKLSDPQSALGILIGSDYRPYNWCPEKTTRVDVFAQDGSILKTLEAPADISAVCEIMMGAFSSEGIEEGSYHKVLAAHGIAESEIVILEGVAGKPVFRVKGMPFSSPMLSKALDRLAVP